jgi:hypothetical protein
VRAAILLIGLLANPGYGTLSFTLNYAMAGGGITNSLIYQMLRMALMGYIAIPFTFWFLSRFESRLALLAIQLLGLGFFFIDQSSGFWAAIGVTIAFSPYLALHQYRFAKNISRDNRGNEAALNSFLIVLGYSGGIFIGGVLLQHDLYIYGAIGGSLCTIIGAFILYYPMKGRNNLDKVWSLLGRDKPSSRLSFFYGLFNPMVDGCLPVWMRVLGISPMGAGLNLSLRPLIGLLITPIVGWLIQKRGMRAGQLGGIGMILGWTLMVSAPQFPWLLSLSLSILSVGTNLVTPMEVSRWYKRRSSAGVISREILVTSGRIPSYGLGIMTSFLFPALYPLLGLGISALLVYGTMPKRRGLAWKIK